VPASLLPMRRLARPAGGVLAGCLAAGCSAGPPGLSGAVTGQPLDHYALTRLIDQVIGAPPLRQAAGAPDLAQRLGLEIG
jgi:hypothetical protein